MFTGLVQTTGRIVHLERLGGERRVRVEAPFAADLRRGESVAVDGVCLTVTRCADAWFEAVVSPETLASTRLREYAPGTAVNLEVDIMGRYVVEYLRGRAAGSRSGPAVTRDDLARHGFAGKEGSR